MGASHIITVSSSSPSFLFAPTPPLGHSNEPFFRKVFYSIVHALCSDIIIYYTSFLCVSSFTFNPFILWLALCLLFPPLHSQPFHFPAIVFSQAVISKRLYSTYLALHRFACTWSW
ncbi:hypothetical protein SCHPADRAFT_367432 [Schizopora paradoxa]|uniref:Uncharacterized protein n=1 Tax=Schizopora paradoxa TaxID=27342 RepID=A0A0H2RNH8_9AGAM|nr:hypothetical protein SCHPADRAFT_367432 [Schizopora paradoxa]